LKHRAFEFAVERAVFVGTLHRLFVSGSDRDCSSWMEDYNISGVNGLDLHHFYRAMAWLGEEMEEKPEGALAPRCVKDVIEEKLFDRRRDLFTDLSAVFMDTTSLSFYGEGGETLGEHGYSKDYRPDLKQMILGLVVDGSGWPICTEMWPGNTADVTVLLPVIEAHCEYRRPARYDEEIEVRTQGRLRSAVRMEFSYDVVLKVTNEIAAVGQTVHAAMGKGGRPCRLPSRIAEAFA